MQTLLTLNTFRLMVHLGWTEAERKTPQAVDIDIAMRFPKPPRACETDELDDTADYSDLVHLIHKITQREFRLIEHLTHFIFQAIKNSSIVEKNVALSMRITKVKTPLKDVLGGASFCLSDGEIPW